MAFLWQIFGWYTTRYQDFSFGILKQSKKLRIKTTEICHNQFMNIHEWPFVLESINKYEQEAKYANILTYIKAFGLEMKFA